MNKKTIYIYLKFTNIKLRTYIHFPLTLKKYSKYLNDLYVKQKVTTKTIKKHDTRNRH